MSLRFALHFITVNFPNTQNSLQRNFPTNETKLYLKATLESILLKHNEICDLCWYRILPVFGPVVKKWSFSIWIVDFYDILSNNDCFVFNLCKIKFYGAIFITKILNNSDDLRFTISEAVVKVRSIVI